MLTIFATWFTLTQSILGINVTQPVAAEELAFRQEVIEHAKTYLGLRYIYGSADPSRGGLDCSGFTSLVMDRFTVKLSRSSRSQEEQCQRVKLIDVQPGDLIFFRRSKYSRVHHVAMVYSNAADGIQMIHSCSSRGVVIESLRKSNYWSNKVITAGRIISPEVLLAYREQLASPPPPALLSVSLPTPPPIVPDLASLSARLYATPTTELAAADSCQTMAKMELVPIKTRQFAVLPPASGEIALDR